MAWLAGSRVVLEVVAAWGATQAMEVAEEAVEARKGVAHNQHNLHHMRKQRKSPLQRRRRIHHCWKKGMHCCREPHQVRLVVALEAMALLVEKTLAGDFHSRGNRFHTRTRCNQSQAHRRRTNSHMANGTHWCR